MNVSNGFVALLFSVSGILFIYRIGGAGLHTVLSRQKEFFRDLVEIASSVARVNETNSDSEYWRGASNCLTCVEAAELNKESAEYVHNVVRSSCALSMVENALDPLKESIATITPEIDGLVKDRNAQVIDYDSYRRRVKTIREKKEGLEVSGYFIYEKHVI